MSAPTDDATRGTPPPPDHLPPPESPFRGGRVEGSPTVDKIDQEVAPRVLRAGEVEEVAATAPLFPRVEAALVASGDVSEKTLGERPLTEWLAPNKRVIFDKIATDRAFSSEARIALKKYELCDREHFSRKTLDLSSPLSLVQHSGVFPYDEVAEDSFAVTLNFADPRLFHYCLGDLFAQDEIQTAEFPLLWKLKQWFEQYNPDLLQLELEKCQVALVTNVKRYGRISTYGIYGNDFASASAATISEKTTRLEEAKPHHILAMAALQAPFCLRDKPYEREDIETLLEIACNGFSAAHSEAGGKKLVINTGNWGTGAFGNNPALIAVIQILASRLSGVDRLNYYIPDWRTRGCVDTASAWIERNLVGPCQERGQGRLTVGKIIDIIYKSQDFRYGSSNMT